MSCDPIVYQPLRPFNPAAPLAAIYVPQAYYGVSFGPAKDIHFMRARVGKGAAVALVQNFPDRMLPKVILGHLDDGCTVSGMMESMLQNLGRHPKNVRAFIASGENASSLKLVAGFLGRERIPYTSDVRDSPTIDFAVDLNGGQPIATRVSDAFKVYQPGKNRHQEFAQFANSRRVDLPLRQAFDLREGVPPGFSQAVMRLEAAEFNQPAP